MKDLQRRREFLGLTVISSALISLILWWQVGFVHPPCLFRKLTGLPCATCGGTHALSAMMQGKLQEAFIWNPLVIAAFGVAILYGIYAFSVLFFKVPVLRVVLSGTQHLAIRIFLSGTVILNWIYLVVVRHHT